MRPSGRKTDQMRKVSFERNISKHAEGSCLVKFGDTHVLVTASLEDKTPPWLRNSGKGWVTAEYGMLPRATGDRMRREAAAGKQGGRTQEIQRLIGRSLRAVVDLEALGGDRFMREDLPWEAAFSAGRAFLAYRRSGGAKRSPLPDFYIGAHAEVRGYDLLTRDLARYRQAFPALRIVSPETHP